MMTHEELEEAVPLYAIGALERTERQALEAHLLSGCGTCHAALKDYQGVATLLPFSLPSVPPPDSLKAKILAARNPLPPPVEEIKPTAKPSLEPGEWMNHLFPPITPARAWPFQLAFGMLSLLLLAGVAYMAWMSYARSTQEGETFSELQGVLQQEVAKRSALHAELRQQEGLVNQLRQELDVRRSDLTELRDQLIAREAELEDLRAQLAQRDPVAGRSGQQQDELLGLLRHPQTKVIALSSTDRAKRGGALFLSDSTGRKAWLYAFDLPELPAGSVYQLWAIDEKPASVGFLTLDAGRKGRLLITNGRNLSKVKRMAMTVEPAGGRPQPTGTIVLLGSSS